jgi:hypothetical protein
MPGLDRKGEGGYVVGPGSIVQGTTYEVADWTTLTSTPEAGSPATKVGAGKVSSSMIDKRSEVLG